MYNTFLSLSLSRSHPHSLQILLSSMYLALSRSAPRRNTWDDTRTRSHMPKYKMIVDLFY